MLKIKIAVELTASLDFHPCQILLSEHSSQILTNTEAFQHLPWFSMCPAQKKSTDLLKLKPTHVVPNGKSDEELAPSTPFGLFCAASNFMSFSWTDWIWLNLANSQVSLYTLGHLDMTRVAKGCHVSKMHFIRIIPLPQGTSGLYQRFFSSLVFTTWWEWPKSLTFTETSESTKPANRRTKRSHSFEKRHVSTYQRSSEWFAVRNWTSQPFKVIRTHKCPPQSLKPHEGHLSLSTFDISWFTAINPSIQLYK